MNAIGSSDEEEMMFKGDVINMPVVFLPLLQLHSSPDVSDGHPPPPNTKACKFNCRNVDMSRMTCLDPNDNMVKRLRGEEQTYFASDVDGMTYTVVTSFTSEEVVKRQQSSLSMTSVAFREEKALCHAIPCTVGILNTAILFLEGKSGNQATKEVTTVKEGLCSYLQLLGEKCPRTSMFLSSKHLSKIMNGPMIVGD